MLPEDVNSDDVNPDDPLTTWDGPHPSNLDVLHVPTVDTCLGVVDALQLALHSDLDHDHREASQAFVGGADAAFAGVMTGLRGLRTEALARRKGLSETQSWGVVS